MTEKSVCTLYINNSVVHTWRASFVERSPRK